MKIIDILNKMANGTLEDGFEFCHGGYHFAYFKKVDEIQKIVDGRNIGEIYELDRILNNEIEVLEENKEIEELLADAYTSPDTLNKINELVRAVNKINKEREEK